jgi:2-succinyl-5-enolpyruvyl-6-hydroxy-3-cyclohexene-1-carboxylate synthase
MIAHDASHPGRAALLHAIACLCVDKGISDFIVAPGSRSAPLTAALAQQPGLRCRVVYDERSAGYLALGLAQQSGRPVGLVCTSGTAAINLAAALVEAFYQQVPLLALTADRPPEWLDQQDNQAIHQREIYEPHVRASYELALEMEHPDAVWHALRVLNEAIDLARGPLPGPVHVNVPLREPLYPELARSEIGNHPGPWQAGSEDRRGTGQSGGVAVRRIHIMPAAPQLTERAWDELLVSWLLATRKLIVAGMHPADHGLRSALGSLGGRPDVAVIADITANLFPDGTPLHHADAILGAKQPETLRRVQPDLVISFGGPITSKYIKQFMRSSAPAAPHWRIQPAGVAPDTYQTVTHVLPMQPADFFAELARRSAALPATSNYAADWQRLEAAAARRIEAFLAAADFGEFRAVQQVMTALPATSRLQLGNSMPVRYANLVGHAGHRLASVNSNRGTSGIDGAVSTAVGAALAGGDLTTLLVGDLGFFYDRNGLWHPNVPANLRIVLLNNHGGGIFDIIDGPNRLPPDLHQTYFLTRQPLTAGRTAADHGLDYQHAADDASLEAALADFFAPRPRAALLEIETEMAVNSQVFRAFKEMIATLP